MMDIENLSRTNAFADLELVDPQKKRPTAAPKNADDASRKLFESIDEARSCLEKLKTTFYTVNFADSDPSLSHLYQEDHPINPAAINNYSLDNDSRSLIKTLKLQLG